MNWRDDALCAQVGTELFFPPVGSTPYAAKSVCRLCPVSPQCLAHALADPELMGVWGGTTERERRALRKDRTP